jgi:DNA-binding GntR family transcriptional regulator
MIGGFVSAETLSTKAYRYLHDEIVSGRVKGGTVLSEAVVAESLGISRTPVGEAVRQLVKEGLLEQVPRYGTIVRKLDRVELLEHYELREALESYAAGQAALRASADDVERIRRICDAMRHVVAEMKSAAPEMEDDAGLRRLLSADMAFHLAVVQASGNRRIAEVIHGARSILRIFSARRQRHDYAAARMVYEHHVSIANAIADGDADRAAKLMLGHIQLSKQQALERYDLEAGRGRTGMAELPPEIQHELTEIERGMSRGGRRRK